MSLYAKLLAALACCLLLACHITNSSAYALERVRRDADENSYLALEALEEMVDELRSRLNTQQKRRYDAGYGGRFGVAQSVGSKLMALKQAADWNGPGR